MYGFCFRPWTGAAVFADGSAIKDYLIQTAREYDVDKEVRFGSRVTQCEWSSAEHCWTVTASEDPSGQVHQFACNFTVAATGYYNYDKGCLPDFPGAECFKGQRRPPCQSWPENLDHRGKRVVVIGSGATAVTIVPAMANEAAHVTMLHARRVTSSPSPVTTISGPSFSTFSRTVGSTGNCCAGIFSFSARSTRFAGVSRSSRDRSSLAACGAVWVRHLTSAISRRATCRGMSGFAWHRTAIC